jgi:nitrate reductase NapE
MSPPELSDPGAGSDAKQQKAELRAFLFLTVVMAPLLAGLIVAGYGFAVWIFQLIAGPPGPG